MATDNINQVEKLYVAYFSRPADPAGLQFWTGQLATNPAALQNISAAFAASAEYKAAYANMDNATIVSTVYTHLFGRPAEAAGVNFWADKLNTHTITIDNVVTAIAAGAQSTDLFAYDAKVAVATTFTAHLDTALEQRAYAGAHSLQLAIDFIATVKDLQTAAAGSDPGTIDGVISHIVADSGLTGVGYAGIVGTPDMPPPHF
jgi:hypothetical protein